MKFAKYLQQNQTPEWQRAYIDYRGLKKKIHKIQKNASESQLSLPTNAEPDSYLDSTPVAGPGPSTSRMRHGADELSTLRKTNRKASSQTSLPEGLGHRKPSSTQLRQTLTAHTKRSKSFFTRGSSSLPARTPSHPYGAEEMTLRDLIPLLSPQETNFVEALDRELHKIDNFYDARKREMEAREKLLKDQLVELNVHHQRFHEAKVKQSRWMAAFPNFVKLKERNHDHDTFITSSRQAPDSSEGESPPHSDSETMVRASLDHKHSSRRYSTDPEEFESAEKKLKKAVLEHYRGLEMLQNYRILNTTGFRKALKKFEKITRIPLQNPYMTEKVDTSSFESDKTLRGMIDEMEVLYASHFAHGDKKRAKTRLRAGGINRTYYSTTFNSGILLGIGIPALVSGIVSSFQADTRANITGWDGLLFAYSVLFIPVVFSFLVGINLLVWSRSRINYVFIFELDPRTRLDHREYFGIPSLLFATFCYAFWLSFAQIGAPSVSPHIWPLVWLGFVAVFMFNPLNIFFKTSRYWLIKSILKLLAPGTRRVEFADFWMGDQFCSLIFTLSDLYVFSCSYARDFNDWRSCGSTSKAWPAAFTLAMLPFLIRVLQSIKRYVDSGLSTHLINGGKYLAGIVYYLTYYIWRHHGSTRDTSFAIWCLFGTIYALYASAWDFWMDWSILRPHAKYPFLREELIYTDYIPLYYFAIISNICIRFIWVLYIPSTPDMYIRLFIAGFLEMLRRWQWNFIRLENEHLGNMDQYRVTREVPLPYHFDHGQLVDTDEG